MKPWNVLRKKRQGGKDMLLDSGQKWLQGFSLQTNVFNTDGSHPGRGGATSDSEDRRKNYI